MISISLDRNEVKWKNYLKDENPKGIYTIFINKYIQKDYLANLRYTFIPQYILVNAKMNIEWRDSFDFFNSDKDKMKSLDDFLKVINHVPIQRYHKTLLANSHRMATMDERKTFARHVTNGLLYQVSIYPFVRN